MKLDRRRRLRVQADLRLFRCVTPPAHEHLPRHRLPPVAIPEVRVGGTLGDPPGNRGRGEHLGPSRLDVQGGQQRRREAVGGEDHRARRARRITRMHRCARQPRDVHALADRARRRARSQSPHQPRRIHLTITRVQQPMPIPRSFEPILMKQLARFLQSARLLRARG